MKKTLLLTLLFCAQGLYAQFSQPEILAGGPAISATDVKTADLDGDGDKDLVCSSSSSNSLFWFVNDGAGHFGDLQTIVPSGLDVEEMTVADLDNDGSPDLLCASWDENKIVWYRNLGNGVFGPELLISAAVDKAISVAAADLDNDGDLDVLSASRNDWKIARYENLGNGNFGAQVVICYAQINLRVRAADLDNDGLQDIIYSGMDNDGVKSWVRNMDGDTFDTPQPLIPSGSGNGSSKYMESGDMDNDGDADLVSDKNGATGFSLVLFESHANGTFSEHVIATGLSVQNYGVNIALADLDNDGDEDIVTGGTETISWYKNTGNSTFAGAVAIAPATSLFCVGTNDVNNDGDADILVGSAWKVELLTNHGNAVFGPSLHLTQNASNIEHMLSADINGDGLIDLVSQSNAGVCWWQNDGEGGYAQHTIHAATYPKELAIADYDNDNDPDVAAVVHLPNNSVALFIFENQGTDFWVKHQVSDVFMDPMGRITSSDVDGDGNTDLLYTQWYGNDVHWYRNLGQLNFAAQTLGFSTTVSKAFAFDDDNDGDGELFVSMTDYHQLYRMENLGNGAFGEPDTIAYYQFMYDLILVVRQSDVDMDGDPDLVISSDNGYNTYWKENNGDGTYAAADHIIGSAVYETFLPDLDNDGDPDFVSRNYNSVSWRENNGTGTFGPAQSLYSSMMNDLKTVVTYDSDNDGDMDIIWAQHFDNLIVERDNLLYASSQVRGRLYLDANQNQQYDAGEIGLGQAGVYATPASDFTYTYSDGRYSMLFSDSPGTYVLQPAPLPHWQIVSDSASFQLTVDSTFESIDSLDFGFYPTDTADLIDPQLIGGFPRCNTIVNYWLDITNTGTTIPSGILHLQLDGQVGYVSSAVVPDSVNGQHLYWSFDSLAYFDNRQWNIQVQMPSFLAMGDRITSYLSAIVRDVNGEPVVSFTDSLEQVLVCAYDPNDKTVTPAGITEQGYVAMDTDWFEYTVRFQNTGNDTAIHVVIVDQLDADLDRQTLQLLAWSHPVEVSGDQFGTVTFSFPNIQLPDSTVNEVASHGFVRYRIRINENALPGTQIENTAHIYFDQNPPVITNTAVNTLRSCPQPATFTISSDICRDEPISTAPDQPDPTELYHWSLDGVEQTGETFNAVAAITGNHTLQLTSTSLIGCPEALFQSSFTVHAGDSTLLDAVQICSGESANIFGIQQTQAGTYFTTLETIHGCDSIVAVHLTVLPLPAVTLPAFSQDTLCLQAAAIALPEGTPAGGIYSGAAISGNNFDPALAGPGIHSVVYSFNNSAGCSSTDSATIDVVDCLGLDEFAAVGITVFPNPFSGEIHLNMHSTSSGIAILCDLAGKPLTEQAFSGQNTLTIHPPAGLSAGTYLLSVMDSETGQCVVERVVKR
jgi:hypothetical protein